jgi:hypothetical protein
MILDRDRGASFVEQCAGLEEELRAILNRFQIPELDAEELLQETAIEVLYKSAGPEEFAVRLGPALRIRCRLYWETRRRRFYGPPAERTAHLGARRSGDGAPGRNHPAPLVSSTGRRRGASRVLRRLLAAFGLLEEA